MYLVRRISGHVTFKKKLHAYNYIDQGVMKSHDVLLIARWPTGCALGVGPALEKATHLPIPTGHGLEDAQFGRVVGNGRY
jgi:hypothetical protein